MKTPAQRYIEGQRGRDILDGLIDDFVMVDIYHHDMPSAKKIMHDLFAIKRLMACCDQDEWCQCEKKNDE